MDVTVLTGDGELDVGHLLVLAAAFPKVIGATTAPKVVTTTTHNTTTTTTTQTIFSSDKPDGLILPDFVMRDYHNLLALLYGGPQRFVWRMNETFYLL